MHLGSCWKCSKVFWWESCMVSTLNSFLTSCSFVVGVFKASLKLFLSSLAPSPMTTVGKDQTHMRHMAEGSEISMLMLVCSWNSHPPSWNSDLQKLPKTNVIDIFHQLWPNVFNNHLIWRGWDVTSTWCVNALCFEFCTGVNEAPDWLDCLIRCVPKRIELLSADGLACQQIESSPSGNTTSMLQILSFFLRVNLVLRTYLLICDSKSNWFVL